MGYTKFQQTVIEALKNYKSKIKNCCKNALLHLEKAWLLKDIDKEMAVFRGITAEEEAAVAIFFCLKQHQYNNADKLQFKQHFTKFGLYPFISHIKNHLTGTLFSASSPFKNCLLKLIEVKGRKALGIAFKIKGHNYNIMPLPSLQFNIFNHETGEIQTYDIDFKKIYLNDHYKDSLKYIKEMANQRNKLLYANSAGKPKVVGDTENYLNIQKIKIFLFIKYCIANRSMEKEEDSSGFVQ